MLSPYIFIHYFLDLFILQPIGGKKNLISYSNCILIPPPNIHVIIHPLALRTCWLFLVCYLLQQTMLQLAFAHQPPAARYVRGFPGQLSSPLHY